MTGWAQHDAEVHEDERETIRRLEEENERLTASNAALQKQLDDLLTGNAVIIPYTKEQAQQLLGIGIAITMWEGNSHIEGWKDR